MISLTHKFLFVHIGKNAGNSITRALDPFCIDKIVSRETFQDGRNMFDVENDTFSLRKHSTLNEYKAAIPSDIYSSLAKFCVVRNPWDRLISVYYSPEKVARGKTIVGEYNQHKFKSIVSIQKIFRQFASTSTERTLCEEMDFVTRFEDLPNGFARVCEAVKLPSMILPHRIEAKIAPHSEAP